MLITIISRILAVILLIVGSILYFSEEITIALTKFRNFFFTERVVENIVGLINKNAKDRKPPIGSYIKQKRKENKPIFFIRAYNEMKEDLEYIGEGHKAKTYVAMYVLGGIIGFIAAVAVKSYLLAPVLFVGGTMIPTWIAKLKEYSFRKKINAELSVSLSAVTASYVRSGNIIKAVEENIDSMRRPVKNVFMDFLNRYKYIDKNLKTNIKILSDRFNNKIFKLWCQELTVCLDDDNYKNNLNSVVSQFAADKELQDSLSVKLSTPIRETLLIVGISLLLYPLLAVFGIGTLDVLLNTIIGQVFLSSMWLMIIFAVDKAIRVSAPVE